jgi:hypothetical protein
VFSERSVYLIGYFNPNRGRCGVALGIGDLQPNFMGEPGAYFITGSCADRNPTITKGRLNEALFIPGAGVGA